METGVLVELVQATCIEEFLFSTSLYCSPKALKIVPAYWLRTGLEQWKNIN
jgi:hypothetical protein